MNVLKKKTQHFTFGARKRTFRAKSEVFLLFWMQFYYAPQDIPYFQSTTTFPRWWRLKKTLIAFWCPKTTWVGPKTIVTTSTGITCCARTPQRTRVSLSVWVWIILSCLGMCIGGIRSIPLTTLCFIRQMAFICWTRNRFVKIIFILSSLFYIWKIISHIFNSILC